MIVSSKEEWLTEYRKDKSKIWFWVYFENKYFGFNDYNDWFQIIESNAERIIKVGLQFRSRIVEHDVPSGSYVYIIRSILGKVGENAINTITIGIGNNNTIDKTIYINEGLIERYKESSGLEDCFVQAIYNKG